jgi:(1->4)-alpha-D-glucan 1-alpha-D-glucosylmutase
VLHYTAPGVPDLYQGAELWDLSLVDPDNRRPVDYAVRQKMLEAGANLHDWRNGGAKLALIQRLLALRQSFPEAFEAKPEPISAPANVLAFQRGNLLVAVPLRCACACMERSAPLPSVRGLLGVSGIWRNALDAKLPPAKSLDCADLFASFPAAVLIS